MLRSRSESCERTSKDTSALNLVSLFHKIPDYAEVKHLRDSEFARALESLKEEFRQCRASLFSNTSNDGTAETERSFQDLRIGGGRAYSPLFLQEKVKNTNEKLEIQGTQSCLHHSPFRNSWSAQSNISKPFRSLSFNVEENKGIRRVELSSGESAESITSDLFPSARNDIRGNANSDELSELSKLSVASSPDLSINNKDAKSWKFRDDYVPPKNVEKRLLERKPQNGSAPDLSGENREEDKPAKGYPVPAHVYKPLYDFIMLKNQRRSQKIREQSKQKLMAQVKPFSFISKEPFPRPMLHQTQNQPTVQIREPSERSSARRRVINTSHETLNNTRPIRPNSIGRRCHTHNNFGKINRFSFRANPAPPRTKAIMSALKLKEQQEYRELKKRLRAEELMKAASLPPSMAFRAKERDHRIKLCNSSFDTILQDYQNACNSAREKDKERGQSTDVDVDDFSDEDRIFMVSEKELNSAPGRTPNTSRETPPWRDNLCYQRGKSRHNSGASVKLFECTSNDNLASRLRIEATRKKEAERMKREEEEMLLIMKHEVKRKRLKDWHLSAWRRAHSYSSQQDIAMRKQLRTAAAILERENFVRDMSTMLNRVQSAPLLLEGVRERRFEPCRKHRDEFRPRRNNGLVSNNKITQKSRGERSWKLDQFFCDDEFSHSDLAVAEGSLSPSENDESEQENDGNGSHHEIFSEKNLEDENGGHVNEDNQN